MLLRSKAGSTGRDRGGHAQWRDNHVRQETPFDLPKHLRSAANHD
jgi:hypothetical protein